MSSQPTIAFFDLDRTLLEVNSATLWVRRQVREKRLSGWGAIRVGCWLAMYRLGFADMGDAVRKAIGSLEGLSEADVRDRTSLFWDEEIAHRIRPGAWTALDRHRARGDHLVLLTSSSRYLSDLAAKAMDLDDVLCNRFAVSDGLFTGEVDGTLCYGEGKLLLAQEMAEARGVSLEACTFYTDSSADLSVLEVVGHPVVVHPDLRLLRHAKSRSWPVVDWTGSSEE